MKTMYRSMLFVPADSDRKMTKALDVGADALILDLEDAIVPSQRTAARQRVQAYLTDAASQTQSDIWVRINALDSADALEDLVAIMPGQPVGIVLPKIQNAHALRQLDHYLEALEVTTEKDRGKTQIIPVATETPEMVWRLGQLAGVTERLQGLMWGAEDLSAKLGAASNRNDDERFTFTYRMARSLCLLAASAAQVQAIDTLYPNFKDLETLRSSCATSRRDGFTGKLAIHPAQVCIINEAFTPSDEEIAHAERVIAAFEENPDAGVVALDGHMLDRPHRILAERILMLANKVGAS